MNKENNYYTSETEVNDVANVEVLSEIEVETESLSDRAKIISPGRMVAKRFFRSKLSVIGLVVLILLFLFSFLGPVVMNWIGRGWGETEMDKDTPAASYAQMKTEYNEIEGNSASGLIEIYVVYYEERPINMYASPDYYHWLGTDKTAMDNFVRLMYGGRISLTLSFMVIFLEAFIGVILGGLAGYFGKWFDQIVMRVVDILYCLPSMPLMLIIGAITDGLVFNGTIPESSRIYILMGILTLLGWAGFARLVRGQILFLREQEYMVAAEALGLSVPRKIFKHLIPNVLPQLIVQMTLGLGSIILTESTLSYLGLGVQDPYAAWGTMISLAKDQDVIQNYWFIWIPPGILIVLAVLAFNFVGDGLRDAFDPKMKR